MAIIKGTAGDDDLTGTDSNDVFRVSQGGADTVHGLDGHDTFQFGATYDPSTDVVDGGDGDDVLDIDAPTGPMSFLAASLTGVEDIRLGGSGSFAYQMTMNDANVAAGETLTIDARHLHSGDTLTFDGTAETDGNYTFLAGNGHYNLTGGQQTNTYNFGDNFNQQDTIGGPNGSFNELILNGDYTNLVFQNAALSGLQEVQLDAGHSYNIEVGGTTNGQVGSADFFFDGHRLGAADTLTFTIDQDSTDPFEVSGGDGADHIFGSHNATMTISTGGGDDVILTGGLNDVLTGGAGNDQFVIENPDPVVTIHGGSGDDTVSITSLTGADYIDGGSGDDTVTDNPQTGNDNVTLGANTLLHVEHLDIVGGGGIITTIDANVAAGATLEVTLNSRENTFDGSAETDGHFVFDTGSQGELNTMTGGALSDTFNFEGFPSESTDIINVFNFDNDLIQFAAVTGIDTEITTGTLDARPSFTKELKADIGNALGAHHAILFMPDSGSYAGDLFLIVDGNGKAGWQASTDLVIQLANPLHLGDISAADFTA